MLTNPNTLGLFEEDIAEIAAAVHEVGGLLYYDGANLNAILGVTRPGDMGFDIVHMNLHKTFAVPHGGGGPGAGPVAVSDRLAPFLPGPSPCAIRTATFGWDDAGAVDRPGPRLARQRPGPGPGLQLHPGQRRRRPPPGGRGRGAQRQLGADPAARALRHPVRPALHARGGGLGPDPQARSKGVKALDVAKRLLEEGFHAPTVYFPLIVEEALMIEPTETESPQTLEALADALIAIARDASPDDRAGAPQHAGAPGRRGPRPPASSSPPSTPAPPTGARPIGRRVPPTAWRPRRSRRC